ncbi:UNVERIFIED_CONTAM: hypothetical protein FKN15_027536 [Acipenser sinensis]
MGSQSGWVPGAPMVWKAGDAPLPSLTGLDVKLGSLAVLLVMTLLCGFIPLCVLRGSGRINVATATRRTVLSLVSCFAGGVFLATCLLDLVPDYLAGITEVFDSLQVTLQFPLPEFIMAMGFFLVLVMEQMVLAYKDQSASSLEERRALLGDSSIQSGSWDHQEPVHRHHVPSRGEGDRDEGGIHLHVDFNSHSATRSLILVVSLSLHSVFEGLAVGLQAQREKVLEICAALLIHKCVIAFSLTLKLVQNRLRKGVVAACLLLFSAMSPLGIGLGITLTESASAVHQLPRSVLEGIAAGTFLYITFLEILPHELGSPEKRGPKLLLLLMGFAVVTGLLFIKI